MPGKGPPPKKRSALRRPSNAQKPKTVAADGELRGLDLPLGIEWHDQTRIWWDNWRRSAQSLVMSATDWDYLLDTAVLHTLFWSGALEVAGELRLRVAKFGATPEDRLRLHLELGDPDDSPKKAAPAKRYAHLRSVDAG